MIRDTRINENCRKVNQLHPLNPSLFLLLFAYIVDVPIDVSLLCLALMNMASHNHCYLQHFGHPHLFVDAIYMIWRTLRFNDAAIYNVCRI